MEIKIMHLYPDLLNLYGDKGNIESLRRRLLWRGIEADVCEYVSESEDFNISDVDIIFLGGGSDREMKTVSSLLIEKKQQLKDYVENGGTLVAVCGGYQLLGKYYEMDGEKVEGLGILDISTRQSEKRLVGNVVIKSDVIGKEIVGFENHGGCTDIGSHDPLGTVVSGNGNDGKSGKEGVIYKNVVATYLHGPLLPKNPQLCDYILEKTLNHKYPEFDGLKKLDDSLEDKANEYMYSRIVKK